MAKRRIASFEVVFYKDGDLLDVSFYQAKKVPKAYDNFVASMELACLNAMSKILKGVENGNLNTKPE